MSYFKVTVGRYDNEDDKYKSTEVYSQVVTDLDIVAVIDAVNKVNTTQTPLPYADERKPDKG